jgi:hypothetical protein
MNSSDSGREDARRFPRVSENCRVRYRMVEEKAIECEGRRAIAVNISGGGLRFESDAPLPCGRMVVLDVDLPGFPSSVVALGKVVWNEPGGRGRYQNGIEFWWVGWRADEAQTAMLEYISRKLADEARPAAEGHFVESGPGDAASPCPGA